MDQRIIFYLDQETQNEAFVNTVLNLNKFCIPYAISQNDMVVTITIGRGY